MRLDPTKYVPPKPTKSKPSDAIRRSAAEKYWVKNFQAGRCISCGKPRDKKRKNLQTGEVLVEKSPYLRRCSSCGLLDRIRHQRRLKWRPWKPGGRGRPPNACLSCGAPRGEHWSWCGREKPPKEIREEVVSNSSNLTSSQTNVTNVLKPQQPLQRKE